MLEKSWFSQHGYSNSIVYDQASHNTEMISYLQKIGIEKVPVPSRLHCKNVLEGKHIVLGEILVRLTVDESNGKLLGTVKVQQMFRISNLLYGNDCLNSFELAMGYTPNIIIQKRLIKVLQDLIETHEKIKTKRKLATILYTLFLSTSFSTHTPA